MTGWHGKGWLRRFALRELLDSLTIAGAWFAAWKGIAALAPGGWCGAASENLFAAIITFAVFMAANTGDRPNWRLRAVLGAIVAVGTAAALLAARIVAGCTGLGGLDGHAPDLAQLVVAGIVVTPFLGLYYHLAERSGSRVDTQPTDEEDSI